MSLDSQVTLTDGHRESLHSYPPTPPVNPSVRISPPSPQSIRARLQEVPLSHSTPAALTHFVLAPQVVAPAPTAPPSLFARVLSAIKSTAPSDSNSFTMCPVPTPGTPTANPELAPPPIPLLTYTDKTPVWTLNATYGTIEIDHQRERELGVQSSFYIAIALTYLDFLMEREAS